MMHSFPGKKQRKFKNGSHKKTRFVLKPLSEVHLFLRYVKVRIHSEASPTAPRPQPEACSRYLAGFALSRPRWGVD
jgi:hypothetical protein